MPCYRPLVAWRGPKLASGKRSVVFKPSESTGGLVAFPQKLPCGSCVGCKMDRAQDWSVRCLREAQMHKENCFITLTYDDAHLPLGGTLVYEDWRLFVKRLRRYFRGTEIRYFHAGEYGTEKCRPHDHALLFGCDFSDRQYFKTTQAGERLYTSGNLSSLWKRVSLRLVM